MFTFIFILSIFAYAYIPVVPKSVIVVYQWPKSNTKKPPFTAYGMVDLDGDYGKYYSTYKNNTKTLEDSHFKRKVKSSAKGKPLDYELVFTHWLIGEIFRIKEEHRKAEISNWVTVHNLSFPGKQKAMAWTVTKYLMKKTKSGWVGDKFKEMKVTIHFIEMGKNKTRIYYKMKLDAHGERSLIKVKTAVNNSIRNIIRLYK